MFFRRVGRYLETLSDSVSHEIATLEALGDLTSGEITPDDVVDEVLLRGYQERDEELNEQRLQERLMELAREALAAAVTQSRARRRRAPVTIDTEIPDIQPRDEPAASADERRHVDLDDILPDLDTPMPDDEIARRELRDCLRAAF